MKHVKIETFGIDKMIDKTKCWLMKNTNNRDEKENPYDMVSIQHTS